jgi:diguanylate cyclase (GGDEF)-like protein
MAESTDAGPGPTARGNHFSCSMTAILIVRVHSFGGDAAVARLLREAGSERAPDYLQDIGNWVSYDEAVALWESGERITRHPAFARALGDDAARRLNGSPMAGIFRSLGSPEAVYRQIATAASKFSTVTDLEAVDTGPGHAEIVAVAAEGFPRNAHHCAWTTGLLSQPTVLFGFAPARVEHDDCAALGAASCRYRLTWATDARPAAKPAVQVETLREQLAAITDRLDGMFAIASDLVGSASIGDVLARITDRAAAEVRAPRYLLAVRAGVDGEILCHHRGFGDEEVADHAARVLTCAPDGLPASWLVVPVRSTRREYGHLVAMYDTGHGFFAQERALLEVYARYAASALDTAGALAEAERRHDHSSTLLELARVLAGGGTSGEVSRRLCDAVPNVVDCDRVGVYLWDDAHGAIVRRATSQRDPGAAPDGEWSIPIEPGGLLERLLRDVSREPMFINADEGDPVLQAMGAAIGAVASILVPISVRDEFLGFLTVSVMARPERLRPNPDLLDRLSGVAAQATTALENGRLLDQVTHQARHDGLTGLPNRATFTEYLHVAVEDERSARATLFFIDLDGFKPVNDELGHEMGDKLLIAVGERLRTCTRAQDTVARLGGDEFGVLMLGEAEPDDADLLARRLAGTFATPFVVDGRALSLGASIGRAEYPGDAATVESLLRSADAEMFGVKRARHDAAPELARGR